MTETDELLFQVMKTSETFRFEFYDQVKRDTPLVSVFVTVKIQNVSFNVKSMPQETLTEALRETISLADKIKAALS